MTPAISFALLLISFISISFCDSDAQVRSIDHLFRKGLNHTRTHFYVLTSPRVERILNSRKFADVLGLSEDSHYYISFIDTVNFNAWTHDDIVNFRENGTLKRAFDWRTTMHTLIGPLATHLSQIRAMEEFLKSDFTNMVLLEDDVVLSNSISRDEI